VAERARSGTPRRLLRLWLLYARLDGVWVLRGWRESLAWYVSDFISAMAGVFALLSRGLADLGAGYNVAFISRRIGRGQLDHALVQPHSLWVTCATEGFAPFSGSGNTLAGIALLTWAVQLLAIDATPAWLGLLALNTLAAVAILLAFAYLWGSAAFWAQRGAEEINSQSWRLLERLRLFPLEGLGAGAQTLLLTAIPAGLSAWWPARALARWSPGAGGRSGVWIDDVWVAPLAAVAFVAAAAWLFNKGLQHYGHTGSVRYLDFGHRR
jgi:ABC-2 type transport system permease protein